MIQVSAVRRVGQTRRIVISKKFCISCEDTKGHNEFHKQKNSKDGLQTCCKPCQSIQNKKWTKENPDRSVELGLIYKYGITLEQYNAMISDQTNRCKICRGECPTGRALSVDHCHSTNKVRGLLCSSCNLALGHTKDNIKTLEKMITYLEETRAGQTTT